MRGERAFVSPSNAGGSSADTVQRRGGAQLAWRRTQPYAVVNPAIVNTIFARAPYVATASRRSPACSGTRSWPSSRAPATTRTASF
eukprot:1235848-Pyramimonas_sp.AAC.1